MSFPSTSEFQSSVASPVRRGSLSSSPGSRRGSTVGFGSPAASVFQYQAPVQQQQQVQGSPRAAPMSFQFEQQVPLQGSPRAAPVSFQFEQQVPLQGSPRSPAASAAPVLPFQMAPPMQGGFAAAPAPVAAPQGARASGESRALNYKTIGRVKRPNAEKLEIILRRAVDKESTFRSHPLTQDIDHAILHGWVIGVDGTDPKVAEANREEFTAPFYSSNLIKEVPEQTYASLRKASSKVRLVTGVKEITHPFAVDAAGRPVTLTLYECGRAVNKATAQQLAAQIGYRMGRIVPAQLDADGKISDEQIRPENLMTAWECARNKTIDTLAERIIKKRQKSANQLRKHLEGKLFKDKNCAKFVRPDTPGAISSLECTRLTSEKNYQQLQQKQALMNRLAELELSSARFRREMNSAGITEARYAELAAQDQRIHAEMNAIRSDPGNKKILAKRLK